MKSYDILKVLLIMGISGACRRDELVKMTIDDVEDAGRVLIVKILHTKTNVPRTFTVTDLNHIQLYRKYLTLRPIHVSNKRLFLKYRQSRCFNQAVGVNTIGSVPSMIAKYLQIPNATAYTGHCFRRTSATLLANAGADMSCLKRHGGWKSSSVAEGYIEESIENKIKISKKNSGCEAENPSTRISTSTSAPPAQCTAIKNINEVCENQIVKETLDVSTSGINIGTCSGCTINFNIYSNNNNT